MRFIDPLWRRWKRAARTRRGVLTSLLAALAALIAVAAADSPSGVVGALLVGLPIFWGGAWLGTGITARMWEAHTRPATPTFSRRTSRTPVQGMVREDGNAMVWRDHGGFLWRKRYWFVGTGCPLVELSPGLYLELAEGQRERPVLIADAGQRQWWWFEDRFYWDSEGYEAADIEALIHLRRRRRERELEHAHDLLATGRGTRRGVRTAIPEDVRRLVYRRDKGRCQACGSDELLQFDHVIPVALGGSSTPENLQLLCAPCNRGKGARIA